jgi:HD-GYP domain-containing protein (c-di-GMP phosphodiesterase class II)
MGLPDAEGVSRAALVHDLGRVAVPNPVWNRTGPLSSAERDLVEACPHRTQRLLARADWLAPLGRLAAEAHERLDGSGHPHGLGGAALSPQARLLQAADHFRGLVEDRPYRAGVTPAQAADALRRECRAGCFDPDSVEAVVAAAGGRPRARLAHPDGLTGREVEVLGLLAHGLSNRQIAERLVVAPRTVGHHVAHLYAKIGVATRAGATLYALRHDLVATPMGTVET